MSVVQMMMLQMWL